MRKTVINKLRLLPSRILTYDVVHTGNRFCEAWDSILVCFCSWCMWLHVAVATPSDARIPLQLSLEQSATIFDVSQVHLITYITPLMCAYPNRWPLWVWTKLRGNPFTEAHLNEAIKFKQKKNIFFAFTYSKKSINWSMNFVWQPFSVIGVCFLICK